MSKAWHCHELTGYHGRLPINFTWAKLETVWRKSDAAIGLEPVSGIVMMVDCKLILLKTNWELLRFRKIWHCRAAWTYEFCHKCSTAVHRNYLFSEWKWQSLRKIWGWNGAQTHELHHMMHMVALANSFYWTELETKFETVQGNSNLLNKWKLYHIMVDTKLLLSTEINHKNKFRKKSENEMGL